VVGAGGLGCPCALYLAGSGVGTIGIADSDVVALDNLHRQVAHSEDRVGGRKTDSVRRSCSAINSTVQIKVHNEGITPENAVVLCSAYDVIADCTDNAMTRYLINDACVLTGRSLVSGAAVGTDGQLSVYNHEDGPCYRYECCIAQPLANRTVWKGDNKARVVYTLELVKRS
jgi:adenylyltransferase and sulfurtransferase